MGNGWWVTNYLQQPNGVVLVTAIVFWVITSIVLHELAHGWAALALGDRTPRDMGHMTINPFVHMGGMSLVMFALVGIAWGAMPVNPSRMKGRYADAKVSMAGPAMNLVLMLVCTLVLTLWIAVTGGHLFGGIEVPDHVRDNLQIFFYIGATRNFVLMLFNLLPVPPLDGSRILGDFVPGFRSFSESEKGQAVSLMLFVAIFWFAGSLLYSLAADVVMGMTSAMLSLLK